MNKKGSFSFKILFLIIYTLSRFCVSQDPSIARNCRYCTPRPFIYESCKENKSSLQLRELNNDLVTITSHRTFLQNCLNNRVIPDGITMDFPNAIANLDSLTCIKAIISHHDIEIIKLQEYIQVTQNDLSTITTPNRFDFLLKCQQSFTKKNSEKLNFIKSKKLKNLLTQRPKNSPNQSQTANTSGILEL